MGAENSLFKKISIDSEVQYKCKDFSLFTAKYDSNKFSIFLFNDNNFAFDLTHWKTIRHPFIVKYYDCGIFRGKKCVVTEWVQPIKPLINQLDKEVIVSGVHNIVNSLSFLHSTCYFSVNNLCLDSIFISRSESTECWKLGSLLCLSSVNSENEDFSKRLLSYHNYLETTETLPVEDLVSNRIQFIRSEDQIHRRDAFSLGTLMRQLLPDVQFSETIESLRSESISKRRNMKTILNDNLFVGSEFVQIKSYLTSFVSYNENQKKQFFTDLVERVRLLSDNLIVCLVTVIVNSRLIMSNTEVHNQFLPFVLIAANDSDEEILCSLTSGQSISLRPLLNKKVFKTRIIPLICKLYCVRDLRIRLLLLQYLPNYAPFLSKACLRQLVLPQILTAMKDSNNELVSLTFKAISLLVDIFGASVVLGPRVKLFSNGIPKRNELKEESVVETVANPNASQIVAINSGLDPIEDLNRSNGWSQESNNTEDNEVLIDDSDTNFEPKNQIRDNLKISSISSHNKSNIKKNKNIRKDFDIKELDFKVEDNEIDSLFSDMEPVFKFNKNSSMIPEVLDSFKTTVNTSSLFAANEDNTEEMGWTDPEWDNHWNRDDN